ncbi:MAG TPA: hypothetical protein VFZ63_06885 [Jiangellaceae bacterium]
MAPELDLQGELGASPTRPPHPGNVAVDKYSSWPTQHRPQRLGRGWLADQQRPVLGVHEQVERPEQTDDLDRTAGQRLDI